MERNLRGATNHTAHYVQHVCVCVCVRSEDAVELNLF